MVESYPPCAPASKKIGPGTPIRGTSPVRVMRKGYARPRAAGKGRRLSYAGKSSAGKAAPAC
jgi:hypothetical protein